MTPTVPHPVRFGIFELDSEAGQLRREGRVVRLPPQPFKLLEMLTSKQGRLVTREDIRKALWPEDTFIDFEQGVNFAIKQVREALNDNPDNPLYIQTVPKRGYRFIAPIEGVGPAAPLKAHTTSVRGGTTDLNLQKVLWTNIAELRMAEQRQREAEEERRLAEAQRRARIKRAVLVAAVVVGVLVVAVGVWWVVR